MNDSLIWTVRAYIYEHFATTARPPQATDIARRFQLSEEHVRAALAALHEKHALFLDSGGQIRIANPFSAVPTAFEVDINGLTYWANCAWDSFGIPAALKAERAVIRAACTHTGEPLSLSIAGDQVICKNEVIHFLVPFQDWYQDMVFT